MRQHRHCRRAEPGASRTCVCARPGCASSSAASAPQHRKGAATHMLVCVAHEALAKPSAPSCRPTSLQPSFCQQCGLPARTHADTNPDRTDTDPYARPTIVVAAVVIPRTLVISWSVVFLDDHPAPAAFPATSIFVTDHTDVLNAPVGHDDQRVVKGGRRCASGE